MSPTRAVVDTTRALWREVADEIVILDTESTSYLTLNGSGRLLWLLLTADGASVSEMAKALVAEYQIDAERAELDAQNFLDSLTEQGLVLAADGSGN